MYGVWVNLFFGLHDPTTIGSIKIKTQWPRIQHSILHEILDSQRFEFNHVVFWVFLLEPIIQSASEIIQHGWLSVWVLDIESVVPTGFHCVRIPIAVDVVRV